MESKTLTGAVSNWGLLCSQILVHHWRENLFVPSIQMYKKPFFRCIKRRMHLAHTSTIMGKLADAAVDFVVGALPLNILLSSSLSAFPLCNVEFLFYNEG